MMFSRINRHLPLLRQVSLFLTFSAVAATAASQFIKPANTLPQIMGTTKPATPEKSISSAPPGSYMAYADSADMYLSRERWDMAEKMIRNALRTDPGNPGNPMLFANLGVCLSAQHKYGEALEAFEIGLVRAPESTRILSSRALTYLAMQRTDDAIADLQTALRVDSTLQAPRRLYGQVLLAKGKNSEARTQFEILKRQHPKDSWGAMGLGLTMQNDRRHAEALDLFREALTLENEDDRKEDIEVAIVGELLSLDRLPEANDAVRQAIERYPRCGMLYLMRAKLHHLNFQNSDAELDKKMAAEYGVDPQIIENFLAE